MINTNEYFNGKVKSLGYQSSDGKSTVGVMEEGDYEFITSQHELMSIIEGELIVILPGEQEVKSFTKGQVFEVPANATFKVKSIGQTSYLCQYR